MSESVLNDTEVGSVYVMFWRMLYFTINKYEGNPTAELLTLITINLLNDVGCGPTITDLVDLTGLEQSSVSRYVARALNMGLLTEVIDPEDRRLRHLSATAMGRKKGAAYEKKMIETARLSTDAFRGKGKSKDPAQDLKNILLEIRGA